MPILGSRLRVALHPRQRTVPLDRVAIAAAIDRAALALEGELESGAGAEVSLVLLSDRAIRRMNRDYAGFDEPTDVLAFPLDEPESQELGDVLISVETARRQVGTKDRSGHPRTSSLEDEIVLLFVHGTLHLLGHDHGAPDEARRMLEAEHRVMGRFGCG